MIRNYTLTEKLECNVRRSIYFLMFRIFKFIICSTNKTKFIMLKFKLIN